MSRHYTDRQLIDAAFQLSPADERARVETHLAECPACRRRSDALRARLQQLQTLREEITAPEAMIADTVRAARLAADHAPRSARLPIRYWAPVAGLALILIVALFAPESLQRRTPPTAGARVELAKVEMTPAVSLETGLDSMTDEFQEMKEAEPLQFAALPREDAAAALPAKMAPTPATPPPAATPSPAPAAMAADLIAMADKDVSQAAVAPRASLGGRGLTGGAEGFADMGTLDLRRESGLVAQRIAARSRTMPEFVDLGHGDRARVAALDLPKSNGVWTVETTRILVQNMSGRTLVEATNPSPERIALILTYETDAHRSAGKMVLLPPDSSTNLQFDTFKGAWQ